MIVPLLSLRHMHFECQQLASKSRSRSFQPPVGRLRPRQNCIRSAEADVIPGLLPGPICTHTSRLQCRNMILALLHPYQQLDELSSSKTTMSGASSSANLTWANVAIGLAFIAFDAVLSLILGLGIGGSLIVAATRCIVQLTVMGLVLDKVFAAQNVWGVAGIACRSSRLKTLLVQPSTAPHKPAYDSGYNGGITLG